MRLLPRLFIAALFPLVCGTLQAHPEDELCSGGSGLDPALCAALAEADQAADLPGQDASRGMLSAEQRKRLRSSIRLDRPWWRTAGLYIRLGFEHILPGGIDHILFVLALLLASTRFRSLLIQVSVFTLAHTMTLGLAAAGWIHAPVSIVEPLIAVSIAFVAVENLFVRDMTAWRPLVVFGFGLFHGLGFASVLLDLGLPDEQFLTALISFNVGVELGQLTVIGAAWLLLHRAYSSSWYRPRLVLPASAVIAATGLWWAGQRIMPG